MNDTSVLALQEIVERLAPLGFEGRPCSRFPSAHIALTSAIAIRNPFKYDTPVSKIAFHPPKIIKA